ncbi:MAG: AMIN domain-containing protein [Leptolyngbya sp. SIO4C5]|uniref:AMIN domain-containing protein n=1 Tax=Sphaerothrix gracilis TaxID=3151835 RepID=UPI0013C04552|nr:AMIN domain-containing protein [Leptolyngbya sp. SIO4C5]
MKRHLGLASLLFSSSAVVAIAAQPAQAAATLITNVEISSTADGVALVMETEAGNEPRIFTINQGNEFRADLVNTQLRLPESTRFFQDNPAPGVASVDITPLDTNSVRITVTGTDTAPVGEVRQAPGDRLVISLATDPGAAAQQPVIIPTEIETVPGPVAQLEEEIEEDVEVEVEPEVDVDVEETPIQSEQRPDVLVPNPEVTIDGVVVPGPVIQVAPPFLPRAVAPPVGDIAVSTIDATPPSVDLGTAERVPRLVLRNAPTRDVLSLLARAAGLNLAFTAEGDGPRISLDIEDEPVQNVFNYVLRLSGLDANRVGRTIFAGPDLPTGARDIVSRTYRMNQVSADAAAGFLATMGAETTQTITTEETEIFQIDQGVEGAPPISRATTRTQTTIQELTYTPTEAAPVLQGLQAIADSRLNSVTLIGEPRLVELASRFLVQLDLRRRQAAINVKIVDINLLAIDEFGTSFSFGVDDTSVVGNSGAALINFGNRTPNSIPSGDLFSPGSIINPAGGGVLNLPLRFFTQLRAQITNGNAKILTDPTLIVQEGQTASVNLTADVVTNVDIETTNTDPPTTNVSVELEEAGLILALQVDRIDDNGFVTLNVSPSVTAPSGRTVNVPTGQGTVTITLLNRRELSSGAVRLRDGQTLVLAGIIQDQDTTNVNKVPILGDIPIIGALFRSTSRNNTRAEVVVLVTPQILDDSDQSVYGYSYTPSEEVQDLIERSQVEAP